MRSFAPSPGWRCRASRGRAWPTSSISTVAPGASSARGRSPTRRRSGARRGCSPGAARSSSERPGPRRWSCRSPAGRGRSARSRSCRLDAFTPPPAWRWPSSSPRGRRWRWKRAAVRAREGGPPGRRARGPPDGAAAGVHGIGIAPAALPQVFGLFGQGERTLDRSEGGLGIGLTLVKRLVEVHAGEVEARSAGWAGERVRRAAAARARAKECGGVAGGEGAGPRVAGGSSSWMTMRTPRRCWRRSCGSLATRSWWRTTAQGALEVAQSFRPDAGLLDIGLPVMDGYELAERLRASPGHADLSLYAVTGYGQDSDRARHQAAGSDDHFVKPVNLDDLHRRHARNA
jgi:CheY-like chemotaxis protein